VHISCQLPLGLATLLAAISFVAHRHLDRSKVSVRMITNVVAILNADISFLADSNPLFHSRVSWRIHRTHQSLLRLLPLLFYFTFITIFPCGGFDSAVQRRHNN